MVADPRLLQAAELYAATFAGRLDLFSIWNGEHWQRTDRQLTGEVVVRAFTTGIPISGYVFAPDSTTHIACLDIDRADGMKLGLEALNQLNGRGALGYLEPSRRGCHVWISLESPRPGIWVRRMLRGLIEAASMPPCPGTDQLPVLNEKTNRLVCPGCAAPALDNSRVKRHPDPHIELRPGSDRLNGPESVGHCIRMPTMPHHKTGKRYALIRSSGERLPEKLVEMMMEIEPSPMDPLNALAELAPLPPLPMSPPAALRYPHGQPDVIESVSTILMTLWSCPRAIPGRAIKCPAHDDHRPSLSIARDDQRVWCKQPGCVLWNDGRGRGAYELTQLAPKTP